MTTRLLQAAPGARACCDQAGRLVALAHRPIEEQRLVALAIRKGEGTGQEVQQRVADLLAFGSLIEL